jgi:hypothetical protein
MVNEQQAKYERLKYLWDKVRAYVLSIKAINRIRKMSLTNIEDVNVGYSGLEARNTLNLSKKT